MENIKPKSIKQISGEASSKWFRIRDVATLRDYLVLDVAQIGFMMSNPMVVNVVGCEDEIYTTFSCCEKRFALLSSDEEIKSYRRYKREVVVRQTIERYKRAKKS